ncbi:response regulator transcription factor [Kribbella ginsengisoli]|uniref:Response regulator transcription factor n=1 Tax=Kribbella ginsengisoli TaxID=363865 RepID=A0ABP6YII4_9ACTN
MLRCLIVDDSERFLAAARTLLEPDGISVIGTASTGEQALRLAAELRPDVLLVDIDLGGESGLRLAGQLAAQAGTDPIPIILISLHSEEDYAELIAASPAIGFLPKTALSGSAITETLDGVRGR